MNKLIYIEKLAANENSLPPIDKNNHKPGTMLPDKFSLPIEYNVEGEILMDSFRVGRPLTLARKKRNGISVTGFFGTSVIAEIGDNYFKTQNSIYSYKFLQ